jgi:hypothetical protein
MDNSMDKPISLMELITKDIKSRIINSLEIWVYRDLDKNKNLNYQCKI